MKLNHFQAADLFYERVKEYLEQDVAQHCMLLRACYALLHNPQRCRTAKGCQQFARYLHRLCSKKVLPL